MPELKHTFTAGKMNKDLDERLVPNGEYRDALNIQVKTSDGGDAGTVQNTLGNKRTVDDKLTTDNMAGQTGRTVASVVDEQDNCIYFFVAHAPIDMDLSNYGDDDHRVFINRIVRQRSNGDLNYIVNDIAAVLGGMDDFVDTATVPNGATDWVEFDVASEMSANLRKGMEVKAFDSSGTSLLTSGVTIKSISSNTVKLDKYQDANLQNATRFAFVAPPVLGFETRNIITGVSILEDFLFWTDNKSEPRKINIKKCEAGTSSANAHTKLMVQDTVTKELVSYSDVEEGQDDNLKLEHITVIRKAPLNAPALTMSSTDRDGLTTYQLTEDSQFVQPSTGNWVSVEDGDVDLKVKLNASVSIYSGDIVKFTCLNPEVFSETPVVKARVTSRDSDHNITCTVLSVKNAPESTENDWIIELEQREPLFELEFPRFAYRYKYDDNEYSSFSPWSEIAFLPTKYDYKSSSGYNLGMVNDLRSLRISGWLPHKSTRPDDVKAVDILYKTSRNANVYVVKTIHRDSSDEWFGLSYMSPNAVNPTIVAEPGVIEITSELIHKALPSNQLLRAWDNVPRYAKAQEITGNRLLFANYVQGYDIANVGVNQSLISKPITNKLSPEKSAKSMREYQFGVVFGDKYGRETPVISAGTTRIEGKTGVVQEFSPDLHIPKSNSHTVNSFMVNQVWANLGQSITPPNWVEYFKYYVKETSNEYYNLVMSRWYNAEDSNMWISFNSSDRNKVDEETYLILKNENGSDIEVSERATYKIIAISNEAPEDIKRDERIMGSWIVDSDYTADGTSPDYYSDELRSTIVFNIANADWDNLLREVSFKGLGNVRLVGKDASGNEVKTRWIRVNRIQPPNDNDGGSMTLAEQIGDEAKMPQAFVDLGYASTLSGAAGSIVYRWELMDSVPQNKPEFDGKFFVKIEKDDVLERKILTQQSDDITYSTIYTNDVSYIHGGSTTNPAVNGTYSGDSVVFPFIPNEDINSSGDGFGWCSERQEVKDFWEHHISFADNDNYSRSRIFIDSATAAFYTTSTYGNNHVNSRGGLHSGGAANGTLGGLTFGRVGPPNWYNDSDFKQHMTTVGTLFRFKSDPNQNVYQITGGIVDDTKVLNYHKGVNCKKCNEDHTSCIRSIFSFKFRKVEPGTTQLTNEGLDPSAWDPRGVVKHNGSGQTKIEVLKRFITTEDNKTAPGVAGVFETEPKENVELDIYYEATSGLPLRLDSSNVAEYLPIGSTVDAVIREDVSVNLGSDDIEVSGYNSEFVKILSGGTDYDSLAEGDLISFKRHDGNIVHNKVVSAKKVSSGVITDASEKTYSCTIDISSNEDTLTLSDTTGLSVGDLVYHDDIPKGTKISSIVANTSVELDTAATASFTSEDVRFVDNTAWYQLDKNVYKYPVNIAWFNCYSYGNGIESDRIRDDFNAPQMENGVTVSTTLLDYGEERRKSGMIYSGLFNSTSGVNELNEFNQAEKITKDLNPTYGSIQALKTRDTDVVVFTEDKVLKVLANKDALFNADGSTNVTSSDRVLGQAVPFIGDYGISKNPESLVTDEFRMYFTDRARGAVLRLSKDGITPISNVGMRDWFRDNLKHTYNTVGTWDNINGEYNLSLHYFPNQGMDDITVTFNEASKGWSSFKSFVTTAGGTVDGSYFTAAPSDSGDYSACIYKHYSEDVNRNNFYGTDYESTVSVLINDIPGSVKNFQTINYEGSQAKIVQFTTSDVVPPQGGDAVTFNDGEYYNLDAKKGWYVSSIETNMESGAGVYFKNKEDKWFSNINGVSTSLSNLDTSEFTVQGISTILGTRNTDNDVYGGYTPQYTLTIQDDPND